jgi:ABC-type spermidine/putrescine transport system permease subunit II
MHANSWEVILVGILTMALCLSIHALFMFAVLRSHVHFRKRFSKVTGIGLVVPSILLATVLIVVSSLLQIIVWAGICWMSGHFDSFHDAAYFASTTYTTLGAGKQPLSAPYRVFEPLAAMNGMLAAGLNTAILFAILSNFGRKRSGLDEFFV